MTSNINFKIEKKEKISENEAEITGEINLDFIEICRIEAIKHLKAGAELPGFRKGMVPDDIIEKVFGEIKIMEEAAEIALAREYGNIISSSELRPILRPEISITKIAPKNPLSFKIKVVLEPEFSLPNYKKIASEIKIETNESGQSTDEKHKEMRRLKILEKIISETKLELPEKFIDYELNHLLKHFKEDLNKSGISWADYLNKAEKDEAKIKETWREHVVNRGKTELILSRIAEVEGLKTYMEIFELLEKEA